jgi:hypothetical protein
MPLKLDISSMLEASAVSLQLPAAISLLKTNAILAKHNQFLLCQKEQMERDLRRMELLAMIGPPPGLTNEPQQKLLQLPEKSVAKELWDQSTTCSSSPQNSSPGNSGRSSTDSRELSFFDNTNKEAHTTLIIRNLVGNCTRKMLLDFMDNHGFQGRYDLIYLPQKFAGKGCFHYAFVNFVSDCTAVEFQERLSGCNEADIFGEQFAEISWSQCQGLEANIEKFRNSSTMHSSVHDECKPLLFKDGKVMPFPKPTRKIKQDKRNRREAEGRCEA